MQIREIQVENELESLASVIRASFLTVANEFGITQENAPRNPAFISSNTLKNKIEESNIVFYGCYINNELIGCYALEKPREGVFYFERVSIIP
jgi:argonaute-like protein implicated in RNA metabolism and viral defense